MVVVIANPLDFPSLDASAEWKRLSESLEPLVAAGYLHLKLLSQPTLAKLRHFLHNGKPHILHFIGHGGFNIENQDGELVLEDEQQRGHRVSGQQIGMLLYNYRNTLRLVVLNTCEGGRSSINDLFAGTAQSIIQQGIPAVVAMQFEISDRAAQIFAYEFYRSLGRGNLIDSALSEARNGILSSNLGVEWGTPVLYQRDPTGQIFDINVNIPFTDVWSVLSPPKRKNAFFLSIFSSIKRFPNAKIALFVLTIFLFLLIATASIQILLLSYNSKPDNLVYVPTETSNSIGVIQPTSTPTKTPISSTPTRASTRTPRPSTPTRASTRTPRPPILTVTETTLCGIEADPNFNNFYDPATMGCPTDESYAANSLVQQFERGFMVYDPTLGIIYAFDTERELWGSYLSDWDPDDEEFSCTEAEEVGGPTGNLGYVWCDNSDVQLALGNIIDQEIFSPVTYQATEAGQLMNIPALFSQIAIFQNRTFIMR